MSKYSELLEERGWTVLLEETFGDWQGDFAITLKRGDVYAFTIIGYGSCGGCDWYQSVFDYLESDEDIAKAEEDMARELEEGIDTMGDKNLVVEYILSNERLGNDWYRHEDGWQVAVDRLVKSVRNG